MYALTRFKTSDESAAHIVVRLLERVEAANLLVGENVFKHSKDDRHTQLKVLKRVNLSSATVFGRNLVCIEIDELVLKSYVEDGLETPSLDAAAIFRAISPIPVKDKFDPFFPQAALRARTDRAG